MKTNLKQVVNKLSKVKLNTHINNAFNICIASTAAIIVDTHIPHHQPTTLTYLPSEIFKHTYPSVVTVSAISIEKDPFDSQHVKEHVQGTGTGFYFLKNDIVITNAHVIEDAFTIKVDNQEAHILGINKLHDIAVLNVKQDPNALLKEHTHVPLQSCKTTPTIGDPVLAIGNPYGFEKTMTTGIVSGLHRVLDTDNENTPLINLIQTDASINPGNSGGPLLSADASANGCVIGVNTAFVSANGSNSGLGFAVPIDTVEDIATNMIDDSSLPTTHIFTLGVIVLPDSYAKGLGIEGVIIADVLPNSIASDIGLTATYRDNYGKPHLGDIIIKVNGIPIKKRSDLYQALQDINAHSNQKSQTPITITFLGKLGEWTETIQTN